MNTAQLARLRYQPDALPAMLSGLTEAQIRQQPQPGKWSIFEQIAHLGRYQQIFLERLQRIRSEETPAFDRYVAGEDPGFTDWLKRPLTDVLSQSNADRDELNRLLSGCSANMVERTGRHPLFGRMTISEWTEFFLLHEAHHLFSIMKLAAPFRNREF